MLKQQGQFMWQLRLLDLAEQFKHPSWGAAHSQRVYNMALRLADAQGVNIDHDALFAASYLHDVGIFEPYKQEGVEHSERSVQVVKEILASVGFPMERLTLVKEIIKGHMFYSKPSSRTEAVIFHDADTLDLMGVIGITRLLSVVGIDSWTPDIPSAVSLIERFSRDLPQCLHTLKAQQIAKERQAEMAAYLETLSNETNGLQTI